MRRTLLFGKIIMALLLFSCSSDDDAGEAQPFVAAFENPSVSFTAEDTDKEITLVYSKTATEAGTATISYTSVNAEYGTHFITSPSGENGILEVPLTAGSNSATFNFTKLQNPVEGTEMSVTFKLDAVSNTNSSLQGNTTLAVSFTESAALGGVLSPEVGGPNQPNQVYVDLSSQTQTTVKRDTWDLGFYSGEDFRVVLNGSLYMAAKELESTDIDAISEADVTAFQSAVAVGTFSAESADYIDDPSGNIRETAIAEISETASENKVYLVNLGSAIGTETPEKGGIDITDDSRGWKKIRVLRQGNDYVLQYADLNATTHNEVVIDKNEDYNFTFFSFNTNEETTVEPEKTKWDLNFTVFTNIIQGYGAYGYADFVATNLKAGAKAYQVNAADFSYENFSAEDIIEANLIEDQRGIGSDWRNGGGPNTLPSLKEDVFFVLKDSDGNYYKIRFTALLSESGERGYPKFEYKLL
ncbi:HmuY family protein [Galbibacter mesophilus]|uniref:HmuY family protein n=1 Tax=Galbibacter mesophilus TaxID=379069 RepID=UPI001F5CE064|nr:HmuY family protein [Galbibacter mesophilus]MCM5661682.1 HmuY family protein [Galbibacter mesophilus]